MRKRLSSGQKRFMRPYIPLIRGMFVFRSGLRFSFRALEVPELRVRKRSFSFTNDYFDGWQFWYPSWFCHWSFRRWSVYQLQAGRTSWVPDTCLLLDFFRFPTKPNTGLKIIRYRVTQNIRYYVSGIPYISQTQNIRYTLNAWYPPEIPDIRGNTWW